MTDKPKKARKVPIAFNGIEAIRHVRTLTDTVVLGFSGGKDSVAAWVVLRQHFRRIIPIFHYWHPNLDFVERGLRYYENFFGERIIRLPHPALIQMLEMGSFQDPTTFRVVEWWRERTKLRRPYFREAATKIVNEMKLGSAAEWMAVGIRVSDSPRRRMAIKMYGTVIESQKKFYPIADMKKDDLVKVLSGIKLSPEYNCMGRSFDGPEWLYTAGVREHFPSDYARMLTLWPLMDAEFFRKKMWDDYYGRK